MAGFKALRHQPQLLPVGVAHTNPRYPLCTLSVLGTLDVGSFLFISMFSVSQTNRNLFTVQCEAVSSPMTKKTSQHQNSTPMITNLVLGLLLLVMHYCHNFL